MARSELMQSEIEFISTQRVLRFNSISEQGSIHSVPLCFAFDGRGFFVHARRSEAKRWRNVRANPKVSLELDSYSDDWTQLKGVLVYGTAKFLTSGPDHDGGVRLLKEKYSQYTTGPSSLSPEVPVVSVTPTRVTSWYLEGSSVSRPKPR